MYSGTCGFSNRLVLQIFRINTEDFEDAGEVLVVVVVDLDRAFDLFAVGQRFGGVDFDGGSEVLMQFLGEVADVVDR